MASSLQYLTLFFQSPIYRGLHDASLLFSITFPHLKSFNISGFRMIPRSQLEDSGKAMCFWQRHPNLEQVSIAADGVNRWFRDNIEAGFLPKLNYLRVSFCFLKSMSQVSLNNSQAPFLDVRALTSHLGQLDHLGINYSYNLQVPYLLRSVLPDGLPRLKSLEIHQKPSSKSWALSREGTRWYETESGDFLEELDDKKTSKSVDSSYINSIVQGAPNIEELCLHDFALPRRDIVRSMGALFLSSSSSYH